MIVNELGEAGITVQMDSVECEQMARFMAIVADTGDDHGADASLAESLSGLFIAAALIARMHGYVNIPKDVDVEMDRLRERVQGKGGG